jgi:hypothetical protein
LLVVSAPSTARPVAVFTATRSCLIWASWIRPYMVSVRVPSAIENHTFDTAPVGPPSL